MLTACWLLFAQGLIGAFDTLYYHEWSARLPARVPGTASELQIHAVRDVLYALLFSTLPWIAWQGLWVFVLVAVIITEIVLTMTDFVVEIRVRKPLGNVFAGERITHAVMAIVYGAMIANLVPVMAEWFSQPTTLVPTTFAVSIMLRWCLTVMAIGVFLSGLRDLYASFGGRFGSFPWPVEK